MKSLMPILVFAAIVGLVRSDIVDLNKLVIFAGNVASYVINGADVPRDTYQPPVPTQPIQQPRYEQR